MAGNIVITFQEEGGPLQEINIEPEIVELLNLEVMERRAKDVNSNIQGKMDLFLNSLWNGLLKDLVLNNLDSLNLQLDDVNTIDNNIISLTTSKELKENQLKGLTIDRVLNRRIV